MTPHHGLLVPPGPMPALPSPRTARAHSRLETATAPRVLQRRSMRLGHCVVATWSQLARGSIQPGLQHYPSARISSSLGRPAYFPTPPLRHACVVARALLRRSRSSHRATARAPAMQPWARTTVTAILPLDRLRSTTCAAKTPRICLRNRPRPRQRRQHQTAQSINAAHSTVTQPVAVPRCSQLHYIQLPATSPTCPSVAHESPPHACIRPAISQTDFTSTAPPHPTQAALPQVAILSQRSVALRSRAALDQLYVSTDWQASNRPNSHDSSMLSVAAAPTQPRDHP
jgi:hypothetical protein